MGYFTKLCHSFTTVIAQNSSIYTEQCTAFMQLSSNLMKCSKDILKYDLAWYTILCKCTQNGHMTTNRYMHKTQFCDR